MNSGHTPTIRVATTGEVAGARVAITLTVVMGIAIRSRGLGGNILAGMDRLGNGSALTEYRDLLAEARDEAINRMAHAAAEIGANGVVGMRFDSAEAGREIVEIVAYGTAVVLQAT